MSNSPFAAYPLIKGNLQGYSDKLLSNFPPWRFWIHESVVTRSIGLPSGNKHGASEALTVLISCLKKGFGGSVKQKTQVSNGHDPIDLSHEKMKGVCVFSNGVGRSLLNKARTLLNRSYEDRGGSNSATLTL